MGIKDDIKKGLETGKLVIGKNSVLKAINAGRLSKLIVASNCSPLLIKDLKKLNEVASFEYLEAGIPGKDLGAMCKKSFGISILGFVV